MAATQSKTHAQKAHVESPSQVTPGRGEVGAIKHDARDSPEPSKTGVHERRRQPGTRAADSERLPNIRACCLVGGLCAGSFGRQRPAPWREPARCKASLGRIRLAEIECPARFDPDPGAIFRAYVSPFV